MFTKNSLNTLGFAFAKYAVIDKHADELIADSFVNQSRCDARIHTTGEAEYHFVFTNSRSNLLNGIFDERFHCPVPAATADTVNKIGNDLFTIRRVVNFWMKL